MSKSKLIFAAFFFISGTSFAQLAGIYPVGNSAPTYQKITQVAAALNSSTVTGEVIFELQSDYVGNVGETFPIVFTQHTSTGPYHVIIRPALGATNLITAGDPGNSLAVFHLNGVDSLTFDGRPGGVGTVSQWLVRNTRTTMNQVGPTFYFHNNTVRDTVNYLTIEGMSWNPSMPTVWFNSGSTYCVLSNSDVRDRSDVVGQPYTAIGGDYNTSSGTYNKISGCTIRNFSNYGVRLSTGSANWIIGGRTAAEGNNIYREYVNAISSTDYIYCDAGGGYLIGFNHIYSPTGLVNTGGMIGIYLYASSGIDTIRDNSIGGSNPNRTGAAMISNMACTGIFTHNAGTTHIYNNHISNWGGVSSNGAAIAMPIESNVGLTYIGTLGANIIGGASFTGVPSDTIITSAEAGGIFVQINSVATFIENNTVSDFSYYRAAGGRVMGIYVEGGTSTVRNNTIAHIKANSYGNEVVGISCAGTTCTVDGNTINDIYNFNTTATLGSPIAFGLRYSASAGGKIRKNIITNVHADGAQTGSIAPVVTGLVKSSTLRVSTFNNTVMVGMNCGNEVKVTGFSYGPGNTTDSVCFNSVYVTGVNTSGASNSSAFYSTAPSGTSMWLKNNLLFNDRTGGTGNHSVFAIAASSLSSYMSASFVSNNYYESANAAQFILCSTTPYSFVQYQSSTGCDANSSYSLSSSIPATTLFQSPTTGNLKINLSYYTTASNLESKGVTVVGTNTDFENDIRPGPVGSVNGGGSAPDIGADEFDGTLSNVCAGMPTAGTITSSPASYCGSGIFTMNLSGQSVGTGITLQWKQSATSGGPYSNIPGANSTSYTTPTISTTTYYVCVVTCTNSSSSSTTNEVTGLIHPIPTVAVSPTSGLICNPGGSPVALTASGAFSYTWSPTTGLTPNFGPNVSANPTVTTTYTITGTSNFSCTNTATITITVNSAPTVTLDLSPVDTQCVWMSSVTLPSGNPAGGIFSGTAVSGNTFSPSSAGSGNFGITYTYTAANGCSASAIDSIYVDVCTGYDVQNGSGGISVYPNPVHDMLVINNESVNGIEELKLYNALGELVFMNEKISRQTKINLSGLAPGIYFLQIRSGERSDYFKILKQD